MNDRDRQAIDRLRHGDIGGLEALVRAYQTTAVQAAYLIVRDRSLAEDIVQSAFVRAYERIGQFDVTRPFGPWFLRSVVNDAIKAAARGKRHASLDSTADGDGVSLVALLTDPGPGPDELAERADDRRRVRDALGRLSPHQRAAIVLRYYLGLSETEMSEWLDCPPGTVKRRLHDAREHLRQLLRPALPLHGVRGLSRDTANTRDTSATSRHQRAIGGADANETATVQRRAVRNRRTGTAGRPGSLAVDPRSHRIENRCVPQSTKVTPTGTTACLGSRTRGAGPSPRGPRPHSSRTGGG